MSPTLPTPEAVAELARPRLCGPPHDPDDAYVECLGAFQELYGAFPSDMPEYWKGYEVVEAAEAILTHPKP